MKPARRRFLQTGLCLGVAAGVLPAWPVSAAQAANCSPLLRHTIRPLMEPDSIRLCDAYGGQVLLIVNTASKCGFVGQFEGLETLQQRYADQGLQVLGFPSDDFRQEFEDEAAVAEFCELNYGVTFPMFQKVHVRGGQAHPLYADLAAAVGQAPSWNFNKYLVDRQGKVQRLFGASDTPLGDTITGAIEQLL